MTITFKQMSDGILKIKIKEENKVIIDSEDNICFEDNLALTALLSKYKIVKYYILPKIIEFNNSKKDIQYSKYHEGFIYVDCESEDEVTKLISKIKIVSSEWIDDTMTKEKLRSIGIRWN